MRNPVAIGGVGGSGTRVVAGIIRSFGYYIGSDLNSANDNLWFTLLFKRLSVLTEDDASFNELADAFASRMSGKYALNPHLRQRIHCLAHQQSFEHPADWLIERFNTFAETEPEISEPRRWGWKEPNTHVVIERLLKHFKDLVYVHTIRDPLDMAVSSNQNQLRNWGAIFLDGPIEMNPQWSLAYWCKVQDRVERLRRIYPDRVVLLDFDEMCRAPKEQVSRLADFLRWAPDADILAAAINTIRPASSNRRGRDIDLKAFDASDLRFIEARGYLDR
jgi:hypothetical protein